MSDEMTGKFIPEVNGEAEETGGSHGESDGIVHNPKQETDELSGKEPKQHRVVKEPIGSGVLDSIVRPLRKREGFRHLWLGDSGMGKTVANNVLIQALAKSKLADVILTTDDKNAWQAQYPGMQRINPADLRARPPSGDENPKHIVFRGIAATKRPGPDVDNLPHDVAQMAWGMVRVKPCSVVLNIDELADATNGHQSWNQEEIAQVYRKGRGVGISVVSTTQMPQLLPREAFGLSETIGIFRMTTREIEYLHKYRVIEAQDVALIQELEVGEFMLYDKSAREPDRNVYKFVI